MAFNPLPDLSAHAVTTLEALVVMLAGSSAVKYCNKAACADGSPMQPKNKMARPAQRPDVRERQGGDIFRSPNVLMMIAREFLLE